MKKLAAILIAFTFVFSTVGSAVLFNGDTVAEAKSYKSGKKSFNNNNSGTTNKNNIQDSNNSNSNVNKSTNTDKSNTTTTNKGGFSAGGLMKGLMIGGLAGLLFGSLFSDMGLIGNILGFAINAAAILLVVFVLIKIFRMIKGKKEKEVTDHWRK